MNWGLAALDAVLVGNDRLFVLMPPALSDAQALVELDGLTGRVLRRVVFSLEVWPYMTQIAVTGSGAIALATTCGRCPDPPLRHPLQPKPGGGSDVYLAVFTPAMDDFLLATFLGKDFDERLVELLASPEGQIMVAVGRPSPGLPVTPGVFRPDCERFRPLNTCTDDYLAIVDPISGKLVRGTYVWKEPEHFAFLPDGSLAVAGSSSAPNLPLVRAVDSKPEGREAFLYRLSPDFSTLYFSTYLGGEGRDYAYGLHVSPTGTIWIAGETESTKFPLKNPARGQLLGASDGFVAAFSPQGDLLFSSFVGGEGADGVKYLCAPSDERAWLFLSFEKSIPLVRPLRIYPQESYNRLVELSPALGVLSVSATPVFSPLPHYPFGGGSSADPTFLFATSNSGWTMLASRTLWHVGPGEKESDLGLSIQQTGLGPVARVTNHGPNAATGVMVFSQSFNPRDHCPDCFIGTLLPGQTKHWPFSRLFFDDDAYTVSSNLPDPNPANNKATAAPVQASVADLEVTFEKQETPTERIVTARIKNLGPSSAPVAIASWGWYPELGPPEVSASGEASCWQHKRACIWESLAPGEQQMVTLRFAPFFENPVHLALHVDSGGEDPNRANNSAFLTLEPRTTGLRFQYILPIAAHNPGANGTLWRTDLWCVNLGSTTANLVLAYHANDGTVLRTSLTIEAKRLHAALNLLETTFSLPPHVNSSGSVWITSDQPLALASRTYNATANGTFGQGIPVLRNSDSWQTGTALVPELARSFRTNAGCFSRRWEPARVALSTPFDPRGISGCPPLPETLLVPPRSFRMLTDVFRVCQQEGTLLARIESQEPLYDELDAQSSEWCFASWVDPRSGDPTFVPPMPKGGNLLPVVVHSPGLHGSF